MANISIEEVKRLAKLSRMSLTDEQAEKFAKELGSILEYVEKLDSVDTQGIPPTSQVTGLTNVMRKDEVIDYAVTPEDLINIVPENENRYIKVKRVL